MRPGSSPTANGSAQPQPDVPVEMAPVESDEGGRDPFRAVLGKAIDRAFAPILEKARRKREAEAAALPVRTEDSLG